MIVDLIKNAHWYYGAGRRIAQALEWLQHNDIAQMQPGRHAIDGDRVYALVQEYETKPAEEARLEAHRRYIDVQYIARGVERMGYAPLPGLRVTDAYDEEKDALFAEGHVDWLLAREGMFFLFGPEDAHAPGVAVQTPATVRKCVVKVVVDG